MTQSLSKYHARSPRYILEPLDDTLIRVAGPHQTPWEEDTEILNLSLTGVAFSCPQDLSPMLGEVIKIQFKMPNGMPMACHGLVIRLESQGSKIIVAVHFYKLEMAQRLHLLKALSEKMGKQKQTQLKPNKIEKIVLMFGMIIFLGFWLAMLGWKK